jgi:hypothetical protein
MRTEDETTRYVEGTSSNGPFFTERRTLNEFPVVLIPL